MNKITVIRKVVIKSIVTDELKRQLAIQVESSKTNITSILKSLEKQKDEIEKQKSISARDQAKLFTIENEISKQKGILDDLLSKENTYKNLKNGEEFIQGIIDSPVDIKLGDQFFERLSKAEIILHDGEVIEIRNY